MGQPSQAVLLDQVQRNFAPGQGYAVHCWPLEASFPLHVANVVAVRLVGVDLAQGQRGSATDRKAAMPGVETCTIITTEANELARQVHDRMPVIVDPADYGDWLAGEQIPLVPFPADRMMARCVSTYVNNARNQGSGCVAPAY